MTRSWTGLVLALAAVSATGCYTVLRAPGGFSPREAPAKSTAWAPEDRDLRIGKFSDDRRPDHPAYDAYGSGYPIFGYDSRHGMYGFGSPFAYGPGYGYGGYGYGGGYGYSPYYGPYGYGYDPYYSGQVYVPPGYELVTSRELADLRSGGSGAVDEPASETPPVDQSALLEQQRRAQERAWSQRADPTVRRSTVGHRTPKSSGGSRSSGTVSSSGSSKPASEEEKSSGSSAAKRRKQRR